MWPEQVCNSIKLNPVAITAAGYYDDGSANGVDLTAQSTIQRNSIWSDTQNAGDLSHLCDLRQFEMQFFVNRQRRLRHSSSQRQTIAPFD
jgi:hypothetical protein